MELRGDRVVLRPLAEADVPLLAALGDDPEVRRWWSVISEESLLAQARGEDDAVGFAVAVDGELAGLIQYYEETDEEFRHAGMDLWLGSAFHGRGLGTDAVRTLARHLVHDLGHHRLVIDPAAHNERAIRAYEKVGFKRVGIMREYWRDGDGVWRDGLLLDLLASELA